MAPPSAKCSIIGAVLERLQMITRRDVVRCFIFAGLAGLRTPLWTTASAQQTSAAATLDTFFRGAEIQAENQAQRDEITLALNDMATEPPAVLRNKRYADYQGRPGKWTLLELLKHYVVPQGKVRLTDDVLFQALATDQGKAAVRDKLSDYRHKLAKPEVK
jgi:hypothetical protein